MKAQVKLGIGIEIGHVPLTLYYHSEGTFEGALDKSEHKTVYLYNTLSELSGDRSSEGTLPKGLQQLALEDLLVRVSKKSPTLHLRAKTSLIYHFSPYLKAALTLGMDYQKLLDEEKKESVTYALEGKSFFDWVGIGSFELNAALTHENWAIKGELKQNPALNMQQLAEAIAVRFQLKEKPELPASLQSLILNKLLLDCSRGKTQQKFILEVDTSLKVLEKDSQIRLRFALTGKSPEPEAITENSEKPAPPQSAKTKNYRQTLKLEGYLSIGDHQFTLLFARSKEIAKTQTSSRSMLLAEYKGELALGALIKKLIEADFDLDINLKQVTLIYSTERTGEKTESYWLVYASFGETALQLPPLPLLKEVVPDCRLEFDNLQMSYLYTKAPVVSEQVLGTFGKVIGLDEEAPPLTRGFQVRGMLNLLLSREEDLSYTLFSFGTSSTEKAGEKSLPVKAAKEETDQEKKSPVQFKNFKAGLVKKDLAVSMDAALHTKVLQLEFNQLSLQAPLSDLMKRKFDRLTVDMQGVSLKLDMAGMKIAGGLLRLTPDAEKNQVRHLAGFVKVDIKAFSLGVLAEYVEFKDGNFSLLAFGVARVFIPLGPIVVSKIALGFGYNYGFKKVSPESLEENPFLQLMGDRGGMPELSKVGDSLVPQPGTHTVMIGAEVSAFDPVKLISAQLLLIADTSSSSLHVLGLARFDLGALMGGLDILECRILLGIVGEISKQGVFIDTSILPGSYLFFKGAGLSGTGALRIWYTGKHKGDFILSLGGYHPFYKAPVHYPADLKRTSLSVSLNKQNYLKAETYQAFTNTAVMFGARLDFHLGVKGPGFSASLEVIAQMDAILSWVPLAFDLSIYARLHLAIKIGEGIFSKSFQLSTQIDLRIYGPDLGGLVRFEFKVLMKSIVLEAAFGHKKSSTPTLSPTEFKKQFLAEGHLNMRLTGPAHESDHPKLPLALLSPDTAINLVSNIPLSDLSGTSQKLLHADAPFALTPVSNKPAHHSIQLLLLSEDGQSLEIDKYTDLKSQPGHFATATWGTEKLPDDIAEMNEQSEENTGLKKDKELQLRLKTIRDKNPYKFPVTDEPDQVDIDFLGKNTFAMKKGRPPRTIDKKGRKNKGASRDYLKQTLFKIA